MDIHLTLMTSICQRWRTRAYWYGCTRMLQLRCGITMFPDQRNNYLHCTYGKQGMSMVEPPGTIVPDCYERFGPARDS